MFLTIFFLILVCIEIEVSKIVENKKNNNDLDHSVLSEDSHNNDSSLIDKEKVELSKNSEVEKNNSNLTDEPSSCNESSEPKGNSSIFVIFIAIIISFLSSPYQTETSIEIVKKVEVVELSEKEKLQNKIDEANLRIQEAEEAEANLKIEQQKYESIKNEAVNLQKKAQKLYTEEKKKKFEQRISLFIILFSLILIIGLSYHIYRLYMFKKIKNGKIEQLPELTYEETKDRMIRLGDNFSKLAGFLQSLGQNVNKYANESSVESKKNDVKINDLLTRFTELSKKIDEKDSEISRLKDGYDNKIKKSVLKEMLTIRERIQLRIEENQDDDKILTILKNLLKVLDERLEEQELKKLIFEPGLNWKDLEGAEPDKLVETQSEDEKGKVIETVEHGYYLEGLNGKKYIVKKALIKLYKG